MGYVRTVVQRQIAAQIHANVERRNQYVDVDFSYSCGDQRT